MSIVIHFSILIQGLKKQRQEVMKEIRKNNREFVFGAKRDIPNNLAESSDDEQIHDFRRNRGDDSNNAQPSQ